MGFRLAPTPAHFSDAEISGIFRMLESPAAIYRQRYECACGFHGTRELEHQPTHIPCARCGGAARMVGPAERVR